MSHRKAAGSGAAWCLPSLPARTRLVLVHEVLAHLEAAQARQPPAWSWQMGIFNVVALAGSPAARCQPIFSNRAIRPRRDATDAMQRFVYMIVRGLTGSLHGREPPCRCATVKPRGRLSELSPTRRRYTGSSAGSRRAPQRRSFGLRANRQTVEPSLTLLATQRLTGATFRGGDRVLTSRVSTRSLRGPFDRL